MKKIISKQKMAKVISLAAVVLLGTNVFAQTADVSSETAATEAEQKEDVLVLTVEDAVEYSIEHSLSLKSSALDLELSKWKSDTSWNTFLPNVQVSGTFARTNDYYSSVKLAGSYNAAIMPDPDEKQYWTAMGNLGVSFNFNAAMIMSMMTAKESYENGKITYEQAVKSNMDTVRKLFYSLLLQQESLKLQKDSLENARQRMNQAAVNYRNGYVPQIQYLQAQVAYENMVPTIEKAELAMKQSLDTFSFVIGLPVGTKVELKGEIEPVYVDVDVEQLISLAKENNLEIKSLKSSLNSLKLSKTSLDLSTYTPSLSVSWAGQPTMLVPGDKDWGNKNNWVDNGSFSLSLVWNLTNMLPWSSSRTSAKEIQTNLEKLELSMKTLERNTELEVRKAYDTLKQCKQAIETSQRNIDLSQKSYNMTWQAYRNGTTEYLNLVEAQTQLNQAKFSLINEKFNYMTSLMDLETLINSKISGEK